MSQIFYLSAVGENIIGAHILGYIKKYIFSLLRNNMSLSLICFIFSINSLLFSFITLSVMPLFRSCRNKGYIKKVNLTLCYRH